MTEKTILNISINKVPKYRTRALIEITLLTVIAGIMLFCVLTFVIPRYHESLSITYIYLIISIVLYILAIKGILDTQKIFITRFVVLNNEKIQLEYLVKDKLLSKKIALKNLNIRGIMHPKLGYTKFILIEDDIDFSIKCIISIWWKRKNYRTIMDWYNSYKKSAPLTQAKN